MPHRHLIDLPDTPGGMVNVTLGYDEAADTFLVSGAKDRVGLIQLQYDGDVFRRRYADLLEWAAAELRRREAVWRWWTDVK